MKKNILIILLILIMLPNLVSAETTVTTTTSTITINGTISFTQLYNHLVSVNGEEYTTTNHLEEVEPGIWLIKAYLATTNDPDSRMTINSTDGSEFRFGFVHNSGGSSVYGRFDYRDITIKWWDMVNDVAYQLGNRRHLYRDNSYFENITWDTISGVHIGERYNFQSNNSVMKNCYITNWSNGVYVYGDNITIENLRMEDAYFKAGTSGVKHDGDGVTNSRFNNITIKNIGNVSIGDSTGTYGFQLRGSHNYVNNVYVENVRYVCFNIGGDYNTYANLTAKGGTHNIFEAQANNSIYDTIHISDSVPGHTDSGWFTANLPSTNNTIRNVFIDSGGGGGSMKLATTNYDGPVTDFIFMNVTSLQKAFLAYGLQDFVFIEMDMDMGNQGWQIVGDTADDAWISKDITFIDSSFRNISASLIHNTHDMIMANTEWEETYPQYSQFHGSNYTIMYPIDINVTDPTGIPIEGATIKFNTRIINGWGQENTTFYTNSNGTIYEQGNRTKKAYVPDYFRDSTNGYTYTYYNITIIARKLNGTMVNTTHIHANIPGTEDTENIIYPDGNIGHYTEYLEGNVTDIDPDSSWYRPDSEIPPQIFNITLNQTKELGEIVSWTVLPINKPLMCTQATNHSITLSTNTSDNPFWLNNTIPDYADKKVTLLRDGTYYRNTTADATGHVSFYINEEFQKHEYTIEESTGYITINVITQLGTPAQDVMLYLNYTNTTNLDTKKTYTREFYRYFDEKLKQYVYPSPGSYIFREISTEHAYTISIDDEGYSYNITDIFTTDPENTTHLTLSTIDSKPPEQVTNLASTLHGETWIRWTWSNPNIYDMPSYDFEKVLIFLNGTNIANSTSTVYNVTGLWTGTDYNITLMAADYCGNLNTTMISSIVRTDGEPPSRMSVDLISPADTHDTNRLQISFTCRAEDTDNLNNVTFYINSTGQWHANETEEITGTSNTTSFNKTLSVGTYVWNCLACDITGECNSSQQNYTLTIDQTEPNITITSPTNHATLAYTTTSVTLNITTDENAVCRYNTTSDFNYNESTNMTTTGTTTHTKTISVSAGNTYRYYYKCNDTAGNANTNATTHTLSIASAPPSTSSSGGGGSSGSPVTSLPIINVNITNQTPIENPITGNIINTNTTETENKTDENQVLKRQAQSIIDEVESLIEQYTGLKYLDDARSRLLEAIAAYKESDYITAINLAEQAKELVIEAEQITSQPEEEPANAAKYIAITAIIVLASSLLIAKIRKKTTQDQGPLTPQNTSTTDPEIQKRKLEEINQYINQIRPIIVRMTIDNQISPEYEKRLDEIETETKTAEEYIKSNPDQFEEKLRTMIESLNILKQEIEQKNQEK